MQEKTHMSEERENGKGEGQASKGNKVYPSSGHIIDTVGLIHVKQTLDVITSILYFCYQV